jgi:hypothetical protein
MTLVTLSQWVNVLVNDNSHIKSVGKCVKSENNDKWH